MIKLKGFCNEVTCPPLDGGNGIFYGAVASYNDSDDVGVESAGRFDDISTIDTWETEIGDDYIERKICQTLECFFPRFDLYDTKTMFLETLGCRFSECLFVFDL